MSGVKRSGAASAASPPSSPRLEGVPRDPLADLIRSLDPVSRARLSRSSTAMNVAERGAGPLSVMDCCRRLVPSAREFQRYIATQVVAPVVVALRWKRSRATYWLDASLADAQVAWLVVVAVQRQIREDGEPAFHVDCGFTLFESEAWRSGSHVYDGREFYAEDVDGDVMTAVGRGITAVYAEIALLLRNAGGRQRHAGARRIPIARMTDVDRASGMPRAVLVLDADVDYGKADRKVRGADWGNWANASDVGDIAQQPDDGAPRDRSTILFEPVSLAHMVLARGDRCTGGAGDTTRRCALLRCVAAAGVEFAQAFVVLRSVERQSTEHTDNDVEDHVAVVERITLRQTRLMLRLADAAALP